MRRQRAPRDPYLRAIEMIRAASNQDLVGLVLLWFGTRRRTATVVALADLADAHVRVIARHRKVRPGVLLNELRDEMRSGGAS